MTRAVVVALALAVCAPAQAAAPIAPELERTARFVAWYSWAKLPDCGHPAIKAHGSVGDKPIVRTSRRNCAVSFREAWLHRQAQRTGGAVVVCSAFVHAYGHLLGHRDNAPGLSMMTLPMMRDWQPCELAVNGFG